jgi:dGTP triphosphohydrolase
MQYIDMAIDKKFDNDFNHNRLNHSVQVANIISMMNLVLESKYGFNFDLKGIGEIAGLLHDIGHTAGGHEGEYKSCELTLEYSKGKLFFDGNANNFVKLEKMGLFEIIEDSELKDFIIASLVKHPNKIYKTQGYVLESVERVLKIEKTYLESKGLKSNKLTKSLQCQVMDIADEISYLASDISDARNVLSYSELRKIFKSNLPKDISKKLCNSVHNKSKFNTVLFELQQSFCQNVDICDGEIVMKDKSLESIRKMIMKMNLNNIVKSEKVLSARKIKSEKIEKLFRFYFENIIASKIPSTFYRKKFLNAKTELERVEVVRDFLGNLTDKGLNKLYKKYI